MILSTLATALLLGAAPIVPPPRPPGEPPPPAPQVRVLLTASDAGGPRPGVQMQLFRLGLGGRALPLPGHSLPARSGADGTASLTLPLTAPLLVQLSDPERHVLVRFPLGGGEVVRVGEATFRLQVTPAIPSR